MGMKIHIIESPSGEGEAIWEEKKDDLISFSPKKGLNEFIPLRKIRSIEQIAGKMRTFMMHLSDGRSFKCSMHKRDYGEFIKKVPVEEP